MAKSAVLIKDLRFRYRDKKELVIDGFSLDIQEGEFLVIMGANETGKSTLVSFFNGLIPHYTKGPMKGDVFVWGKNTKDHKVPELAEDVGIVFQDFEAQLFSTNVELEVAFGPENFAIDREEIKRRIQENLEFVGLEEFRRRSPATLSGGQKQKLAIASVLAMEPNILVMDEATTDLDPISKQGVYEITNKLRQREDMTLVVVEHDTEEVLNADRIALMRDGKLAELGPAQEILRRGDLLAELGVMPLGIPRFFEQMGSSTLPLTPEEGKQFFEKENLKISDSLYSDLVKKEQNELSQKKQEPIIQVRDLKYSYPNGVEALSGIDLDIYKGEIVAIVGQNGSGKTTLAKHLNALLMPTEGQVEIYGKTTVEQGVFEIGKKVGYVFQNPDHQIFSEQVYEEVVYGPRLRNVPDDEIEIRVKESLKAVGLEGFEEADPFSLTKSGRQRVAVASVLSIRPDVLILDEPTTGLDYDGQRGMMDMVVELNKQGSTIIFITHHMWVVAAYADRVYVVKDGKILLEGLTREIFAEENILKDSFLRPPHFVQFSNLLGKTFLSDSEMISCMEGK
ncbi:MAG: ATP-binding cassette domain-containing protein [Anaerolineales bacterium]|nr:ATP-binding cassette domain-containing protein [Anaerolineales bacterium]